MPFQGNVMRAIDTVVFDIGNVLIPWDPRWLLKNCCQTKTALERFMSETGLSRNAQHDAGQAFRQGIEKQGASFPHYRHLFQAYFERWEETIAPANSRLCQPGPEASYSGPLHAGADQFFRQKPFPEQFGSTFLSEFEGIVVSGEEKMMKPETAISAHFCATVMQSSPPAPSTTACTT